MVKIVAEIGINHNGSMSIIKKLIDICSSAGVDFVKFQKRNPDSSVPEEMRGSTRWTPWGTMSYLEYKHKLELSYDQYYEIDYYCREKDIGWFASVWDIESAEFLAEGILHGIVKIPSAKIGDEKLLTYCRKTFPFIVMSTGMSTEEEIDNAIRISDPDVIMHCNSSYPANMEELNLSYIKWLKKKHKDKEIGYSGHEYGLVTTFATVSMGVTWIERHITLDRNMWGTDQSSSIEPTGIFKLTKGIRDIERAMGFPEKRKIFPSEVSKRKQLRGSII